MLITLGIQLQRIREPSIDRNVVVSVVGKLAVQPVAAWGAVLLLGLGGAAAGTVVILAAMPTAVFAVVLAIEQKTTPELASTAVLVGTLASLVTPPGIIAVFR